MARDFVTSRPSACGERFMLCRNKTPSNGLVKTRERANRHPHKPANLSAKKWNTSAKGNMARARRSRPLPLACRRRGVPVWNCPHRGAPGNKRKDKPDAISPGGDAPPSGHRARVHARRHACSAAKAARPRPAGVCPATPRKSRADADLLRALAPPKKPPGREREDASCTGPLAGADFRELCPRAMVRWQQRRLPHNAPSNFHLQNDPVRLYCTLRSEFLN